MAITLLINDNNIQHEVKSQQAKVGHVGKFRVKILTFRSHYNTWGKTAHTPLWEIRKEDKLVFRKCTLNHVHSQWRCCRIDDRCCKLAGVEAKVAVNYGLVYVFLFFLMVIILWLGRAIRFQENNAGVSSIQVMRTAAQAEKSYLDLLQLSQENTEVFPGYQRGMITQGGPGYVPKSFPSWTFLKYLT